MLTDIEREELRAELERRRGDIGQVKSEELAAFPAEEREIMVPVSEGEARVLVYEGGRDSSRPLIINFHGGGFIAGRSARDELFCRRMACTFNALVLDVDYRLAPQHPYPAAVHECQEVARWAFEKCAELGYDRKKLVLIGHSSGGNLAAGICLKGEVKPCCLILDYPPMDLVTDPAEKTRSVCDMSAERARDYNRKYVKPEQAAEPYASPVYAEEEQLQHFPDTLVITAGEDSLAGEGEAFALKLARSGVNVTARRFTESVHGFVINRMCEWKEATGLIEDFIGRHI